MKIHVVSPGDTVSSIADQYGVSTERLITDNGLEAMGKLVPGQALVIAFPKQTYTVQEGDTVISIANANGITLLQLLRNNPYLSDRKYIYPGETLVISYDNNKGKITTNGYVNSFADLSTLRKTLPFLTYLSVFGYRTTDEAEIIGVDDAQIIQLAKDYKVAPIMLLSTITTQGIGSPEVSYKLLYDQKLVDKHIGNILSILQKKGYLGVNLTFQFITEKNRQVYEDYTKKLTDRLKQKGYLVFITISENFVVEANKLTIEKINYSNIVRDVDGVTLLNLNWGYYYGPPAPVASVSITKEFLDYVNTMIPKEKIEIGVPIIGYDWELPYIIGVTRANAITLNSAIILAGDTGATIEFDEVSQTPFFEYVDKKNGIPRNHIVWFVDARSIDAILNLAIEYGFRGTGIWNIMYYFPQMWVIMNTQYQIETILK